jgi:hypothetical protein
MVREWCVDGVWMVCGWCVDAVWMMVDGKGLDGVDGGISVS